MTDTRTENDAIIEVAQQGARAQIAPVNLLPGHIYAFPTDNGPELVDLDTEEYTNRLDTPQRKTGHTLVDDVDSFVTYYRKHSDADTETYVNLDRRNITAVLNAHSQEAPRWGDHRVTLQLRLTKAWAAWTAYDGKWMSQREFAEHIEERLEDIQDPPAAEMLELAQSFQAKTTVKFASGTRLNSGDMTLNWEETTDATAGSKGQIKIPSRFKIAVMCLELPVPEGQDPVFYVIEARFRYKIERGGGLQIGYLLDDPDAKLRDAVLDVVKQVKQGLNIEVLRGTPASA